MWIRRYAPPREPSPCKNRRVFSFADMAELADALDLGSSGRPCRFESCYPQLTRIIRTRYPSVMDLEFWFIFERKKARSFDLAFLLCLRFLFICNVNYFFLLLSCFALHSSNSFCPSGLEGAFDFVLRSLMIRLFEMKIDNMLRNSHRHRPAFCSFFYSFPPQACNTII